MKCLGIFLKKLGYTSGVMVSVSHLCGVLERAGIGYRIYDYRDDEELTELVRNCTCSCINLQVPSFSDETMERIMSLHRNVVLSIHSTLCNLQVEDNCLNRMIEFGRKYPNLRITCPSECETLAMNAVFGCRCLYLPNTFSYEVDIEKVHRINAQRAQRLAGVIRGSGEKAEISLFSAYRPFKNMVTQVAAVAMLPQNIPVRLHLLDTGGKTPVYYSVRRICEDAGIDTVYHAQSGNRELFETTGSLDLGLQVSLSETFSYVAFEHMSQGVPVVGSSSVPFAGAVADYSNACNIRGNIALILSDPDEYFRFREQACERAAQIRKKNAADAVDCIRQMMEM